MFKVIFKVKALVSHEDDKPEHHSRRNARTNRKARKKFKALRPPRSAGGCAFTGGETNSLDRLVLLNLTFCCSRNLTSVRVAVQQHCDVSCEWLWLFSACLSGTRTFTSDLTSSASGGLSAVPCCLLDLVVQKGIDICVF